MKGAYSFIKKRLLLLLLVFSLFLNLFLLVKPEKTNNKINGSISNATVSEVKDGDTLITSDGDTIRLANIDAPEYPKGCLSAAAKLRLEEICLGNKVEIEVIEKDNFGRQVAWVWLDDLLINKILVQEGLAEITNDEYEYTAQLTKAKIEAQTLEKGIWSSACQPESDCMIKGNYRPSTGTKIYHLPECYNYDRIVIDTSRGDRWFCTEKEAQEGGFRKSNDCP